jgi:hypothetical protein
MVCQVPLLEMLPGLLSSTRPMMITPSIECYFPGSSGLDKLNESKCNIQNQHGSATKSPSPTLCNHLDSEARPLLPPEPPSWVIPLQWCFQNYQNASPGTPIDMTKMDGTFGTWK